MIVLASASPRRRQLLQQAGLCFRVWPADVSEELVLGTESVAGARELAVRKALALVARIESQEAPGTRYWIVGADTIVVLGESARGERMLGKPSGARAAREMLASLSGTRHRVVTGVCVVAGQVGRSAAQEVFAETESTWVSMRVITSDEIEAYVDSGEWEGKAGGYAIQETADRFVERLEGGGFDNVVGLPLQLTLELLERAGAPVDGASHG